MMTNRSCPLWNEGIRDAERKEDEQRNQEDYTNQEELQDAEDASGAVDLPDNVGKFGAGEHHLFGFLAD